MADRTTPVKDLIINAIAQTMGADYFPSAGTNNGSLADLDTYKLSDVGKDIADMNKTDVFTKTLMVQLAAYIMDERIFENTDLPPVYKSYLEYGGYLLKVRLGLYEVEDDPMWSLTSGKDYSEDEHTPVLPTTYAKIFDELKAVRVKYTVYNDALLESMASWEMMARYISSMESTVQNTIRLYTRVLTKQLLNSGIAISDKATKTARHLLTEAKAHGLLDAKATADDFFKSDECIDYTINEILLTDSYMREYTDAFNNKTSPTFSPDGERHMVLLSAFERMVAKRQAALYHDNKMDLGDYSKINWWQAIRSGDVGSEEHRKLETTSAVQISADATNKLGIGTEKYESKYVVAFIYDTLAIGIAERARNKVTSSYTACADFWNMFTHIALNAWVDSAYNMVAFIVD